MSRIGRKPIAIPAGVKVATLEGNIVVKGPKGELRHRMHPRISVEVADDRVTFQRPTDRDVDRAAHGLMRSLVAGAVQGVTVGFEKVMEVNGIGYKAAVDATKLTLTVGLSHPVIFPIPKGISIELAGKNQIVVKGIDKHQVGHVAALIREVRPPEPYKGKGIKYVGEQIRRKVGKKGA
jgi:large subunit ribosomal protein L6